MFPLLSEETDKIFWGPDSSLRAFQCMVPHSEGGTGGILGNQTASTKTRSHGRAGMSGEGAEEWAAGCSVSGGAGEDDSGWLGLGKPWKTTVTNARFYPKTCRYAGQTSLSRRMT